MKNVEIDSLLKAGVHFGHLTRKWNPNMAPYIFMEKKGMHIIDLHKTKVKLEEALTALKKIAKTGRKILFVATKKQSKFIIEREMKKINMPFVTERWYGGMLTNFTTIRKAVKKMDSIDRMKEDGTRDTLSKRERLQLDRKRAKLEKYLGSISDMNRLPAAVFIIDVLKEKMAALDIPEEELWWYLDLRKFGTAVHSGFGLGFDRLVMFVTGMGNIRDVIPYPRTPLNAEF